MGGSGTGRGILRCFKPFRKVGKEVSPASKRFLGAVAAAGLVSALLWAERRYPLRRRVEPGARRLVRNGVMTGLAGITVRLAEKPIVEPLARTVVKQRWGVVQQLPISTAWRDALAVVLLDYTLYAWHVLMHRWDSLYRLHQVHHSDRDLDLSTAVRFHFGEMLASVPWRAAQVALIGASPRALRVWQRLTLLSILFHHANVRLAPRLERLLGFFVMTPRLHGIHHSMVRAEQTSNWSSGLTLWDRLHRTYRDDVEQHKIEIGVPRYRTPRQVSLRELLRMPRIPAHEVWRSPEDCAPDRSRNAPGASNAGAS